MSCITAVGSCRQKQNLVIYGMEMRDHDTIKDPQQTSQQVGFTSSTEGNMSCISLC